MDKIRGAFKDIANSIRSKTGKTDLLSPSQMPAEIEGISGGGGGGVELEDVQYLFYESHRLDDFEKLRPTIENRAILDNLFYACRTIQTTPFFDASKCTSMMSTFYSCKSITTIPLYDTSNCVDMSYMFGDCNKLVNVPPIDMRKCTNTTSMFFSDSSLGAVTLPTAKILSKKTFAYCANLTDITLGSVGNPVASIPTTLIGSSVNGLQNITIYTADGLDPTGGSKLGAPSTCTINWLQA